MRDGSRKFLDSKRNRLELSDLMLETEDFPITTRV